MPRNNKTETYSSPSDFDRPVKNRKTRGRLQDSAGSPDQDEDVRNLYLFFRKSQLENFQPIEDLDVFHLKFVEIVCNQGFQTLFSGGRGA